MYFGRHLHAGCEFVDDSFYGQVLSIEIDQRAIGEWLFAARRSA